MISSIKEGIMRSLRNYSKWIDHYCKLALKIACICLLVMFLIQCLMQFEIVRDVLVPTERWEGRPMLGP